jgi:hypothetical protein
MKTKQPIFIVGAGRSGTTILKDLLSQHSRVKANDVEINSLWKYRNEKKLDNITINDLNEPIKQHIDNELFKISNGKRLLEKTVANVLRINLLRSLYPDSKVIHILRDGRAVTSSARKRWTNKPKASYLISKSKKVSPKRLPIVAFRFVKNNLFFLIGIKKNRNMWGPDFKELRLMVDKNETLLKICACQWKYCVETAIEQSKGDDEVLTIHYEDLVENPEYVLSQVLKFVELEIEPAVIENAKKKIFKGSKEKFMGDFTNEEKEYLNEYLKDSLIKAGYGENLSLD